MKERQILMSAPMVRAILAGSKTQTRRVVKPLGAHHIVPFIGADDSHTGAFGWCPNANVITEHIRCPYGQPGDRLWVRETYFAWGRWETRFSAKKGRDEWHFVDMTKDCGKAYLYDADCPRPQPLGGKRSDSITPKWWKRPAIFMPREACRIERELTGVRVERLQDISEADSRAEGTVGHPDGPWHAYRSLWSLINGADSWAANPWVWVVEFKRVTP